MELGALHHLINILTPLKLQKCRKATGHGLLHTACMVCNVLSGVRRDAFRDLIENPPLPSTGAVWIAILIIVKMSQNVATILTEK
jgi:hypothetical protein